MRIIECDRCHRRIEKTKKIGYVALNWRCPRTDIIEGASPTEDYDFCDECMEEIRKFVMEGPAPKQEQKPAVVKKNAVDAGKIHALADAGWKIKDIAEDVGCSEQTVRNHLAKGGPND